MCIRDSPHDERSYLIGGRLVELGPMTRTGPSMAAPRGRRAFRWTGARLVYPAGASAKQSFDLWTSFPSMPSIYRTGSESRAGYRSTNERRQSYAALPRVDEVIGACKEGQGRPISVSVAFFGSDEATG